MMDSEYTQSGSTTKTTVYVKKGAVPKSLNKKGRKHGARKRSESSEDVSLESESSSSSQRERLRYPSLDSSSSFTPSYEDLVTKRYKRAISEPRALNFLSLAGISSSDSQMEARNSVWFKWLNDDKISSGVTFPVVPAPEAKPGAMQGPPVLRQGAMIFQHSTKSMKSPPKSMDTDTELS